MYLDGISVAIVVVSVPTGACHDGIVTSTKEIHVHTQCTYMK
jgi:glycerol dehydrogenase-like iron-containing ADH family enzyme